MLTRLAHAKLNLILRVDPPVPDGARQGWHPIASWMHAIELADELTFERLSDAKTLRIVIEWADDAPRKSPINWPMESDLVFRAFAALQAACGRKLGVAIRVRKRIPTGAGLGGGSSDGACALIGLNELFGLGLDDTELRAIGLGLGSDVPFFVDAQSPAQPALVTGFGETIKRVERRDDSVTLVIPPIACSTPAVYRAFDALGATSTPASDAEIRERASSLNILDEHLFNDLTQAAIGVAPELARLHEDLCGALGEGGIHLTGSGSALFTFSRDLDRVREIADRHGAAVVATRLA